jgi:hypothetical protein
MEKKYKISSVKDLVHFAVFLDRNLPFRIGSISLRIISGQCIF